MEDLIFKLWMLGCGETDPVKIFEWFANKYKFKLIIEKGVYSFALRFDPTNERFRRMRVTKVSLVKRGHTYYCNEYISKEYTGPDYEKIIRKIVGSFRCVDGKIKGPNLRYSFADNGKEWS